MHSNRLSTVHTFTLSASSQATAAFGSQTYRIRVATGSYPAFIEIGGTGVTATSSGHLMPANFADYFTVSPGQKLATIESSTLHGPLTVSEIA